MVFFSFQNVFSSKNLQLLQNKKIDKKNSFLLSFQEKKKLVYKVGLKQLSIKHPSRTVPVLGGFLE